MNKETRDKLKKLYEEERRAHLELEIAVQGEAAEIYFDISELLSRYKNEKNRILPIFDKFIGSKKDFLGIILDALINEVNPESWTGGMEINFSHSPFFGHVKSLQGEIEKEQLNLFFNYVHAEKEHNIIMQLDEVPANSKIIMLRIMQII